MKNMLVILLLSILISACGNKSNWDIKNMSISKELEPQENITMELIDKTNESITVKFTNNDNDPWIYGEYFSIEVFIDDVWYVVPLKEGYAFISIGYILEPNESKEKEYNLTIYESLPKGNYRIVVNGLTVEFKVK